MFYLSKIIIEIIILRIFRMLLCSLNSVQFRTFKFPTNAPKCSVIMKQKKFQLNSTRKKIIKYKEYKFGPRSRVNFQRIDQKHGFSSKRRSAAQREKNLPRLNCRERIYLEIPGDDSIVPNAIRNSNKRESQRASNAGSKLTFQPGAVRPLPDQ